MTRPRIWSCLAVTVSGLLGMTWSGSHAAVTPSTRPGDLTVIQVVLPVNPERTARLNRVRSRIARPRRLPRGLTRQVRPSLVVVAAAGEVEPATFVISVAVIHRNAPDGPSTRGARDLEDRFGRAAVSRLTGLKTRRSAVLARAADLLSTPAPVAFCTGSLPPTVVSALTSPVLHVEGAPIVPWTPGQILRNSLGLAFRACGQPLPALLLPDEVDRFAREILAPVDSTTTTTLPENCDGTAQLEPETLTDPPYPSCTDVEWITPIPDCADDLAVDVIDVATGQPIAPVLFGHTTHVTYFFGLHPIRLVLRACNGEAGSPGGDTRTLYAVVSWGG